MSSLRHRKLDTHWSRARLTFQSTGDDPDPSSRAKGTNSHSTTLMIDGSPRFTPLLRSSMSYQLLTISAELMAGLRTDQRLFHPFYRRFSPFPRIIKNRSFDPTFKRWSGIWIERSGGIPNRCCRRSRPDSSGCL
jgi:hypothetical protein